MFGSRHFTFKKLVGSQKIIDRSQQQRGVRIRHLALFAFWPQINLFGYFWLNYPITSMETGFGYESAC